MINLMKYKWLFFGISLLVILPGIISLTFYGLKLSIDFTGGTRVEKNTNGEVVSSETVGPVIGKETTINAVKSVEIEAITTEKIIDSSWKFGVSAVIALLHDVLVVVWIFSLLGHFMNVEIDSLFVTALLTVIGFSVHDTIVVFDRIRENLSRMSPKISFSDVANESILQTLRRSIMTSLTVLFTLLSLIIFGGESIRWFVVALLVGIFSGTYSSIFNAAPLLVVWEEKSKKTV